MTDTGPVWPTAQTAPKPTPPPQPASKPKPKAKRKHKGVIVLGGLIGLCIVAGGIASATSGSAKFTVTPVGIEQFSARVVGVSFQVTNTGTGSGAPSCMVTAASSSTNGGVVIVDLPNIKPGQIDYEATTDDRVTLDNPGRVTFANGGVGIKC